MRTKLDEQRLARQMRQDGTSIIKIAKTLGVSKGSVSSWVRAVPLTKEQKEALMQRTSYSRKHSSYRCSEVWQKRRSVAREAGRNKAKEMEALHIKGCMLYWGEGSKSNAGTVMLANTDPGIIQLFTRFLTDSLGVSRNDIILKISWHQQPDMTLDDVEHYWQSIVPEVDVVTKFSSDHRGGKKAKHIHGICSIHVRRSMYLLHHIFGAIQEYAGIEKKEWNR